MNWSPTALVAEDEPLLAAELKKLLRQAWPELEIVAEASDGVSATALALDATPDILFLDIKMPGRAGRAVVEAVIDEWPDGRPTPLVVFITAYDEYALAAFEHQAADYVLNPAAAERLARTVERLRARLAERAPLPTDGDLAQLLQRLQNLVPSAAESSQGKFDAIHVGIGNQVCSVPTAEILSFEVGRQIRRCAHARGRRSDPHERARFDGPARSVGLHPGLSRRGSESRVDLDGDPRRIGADGVEAARQPTHDRRQPSLRASLRGDVIETSNRNRLEVITRWSFSNLYVSGKFLADHQYDPKAKSNQCGAAVMLKALTEAGDVVI